MGAIGNAPGPGDDGGTGWALTFYDHARERWGPSGVLPHHRERAWQVARLCGGAGKKRILELGCGAGGAAAALADLGHDVVALDLSPVSVSYARELARESRAGSLTVREADFYTVTLDGRFDVVACWDSFGVGSDAAQRRLLRRVVEDWLVPAPDAVALFDVFHPAPWVRAATAGPEPVETEHGGTFLRERDFDTVGCRFVDRWWAEGDESRAEAQSIRCYTPADLRLLLEGTGLAVTYAEAGGVPFSFDSPFPPLQDAWSYLVRLAPEWATVQPRPIAS